MQILHWKFSQAYRQYLEWFKSITKKRIQYRYLDNHWNRNYHNRQALVEMKSNEAVVYLNRNTQDKIAEENAAHELSHFALIQQGYAYPVLKDSSGEKVWQHVAHALISWTSDVIIDRKLMQFGYTNEDYQNMVWENTKDHLREFPRKSQDGPELISNSLGYFYCYHSIAENKWEVLKKTYQEIDPPAQKAGEALIFLGDEYDFMSVSGYFDFLCEARKYFNLEEIIQIVDPRSGKRV